MISQEDCVDLFEEIRGGELPYMKHVELVKHLPQHFSLERWQSSFTIPDQWMKKIYKNERYKDTDDEASFSSEPEKLSKEQRKILRDYVSKRRLQDAPDHTSGLRQQAPEDNLRDILHNDYDDILFSGRQEGSDSECRQSNVEKTIPCIPLSEITPEPNLAICYKHKVQPEEKIVDIALRKMKNLKPEEERKYLELLNDREFMQLLDSHVDKYCRTQ